MLWSLENTCDTPEHSDSYVCDIYCLVCRNYLAFLILYVYVFDTVFYAGMPGENCVKFLCVLRMLSAAAQSRRGYCWL